MSRMRIAVAMLSWRAPGLDRTPRRAEGSSALTTSLRAPWLEPGTRRAGGFSILTTSLRVPKLDPRLQRPEGFSVITTSLCALGLDPSPPRAEGLSVIAASPRPMPARAKPAAVALTLNQPPIFSLSLLPWSMQPWQSPRARRSRADRLPGSHGPFERRVNEQKVDFRLTSRRRAALRNLPAPGHFVRAPGRSAGQTCRDPGQDGSPGHNVGRSGNRTEAAAGHGLGRPVGSTRGARRWRPPAS
jgi:hypothetical protein